MAKQHSKFTCQQCGFVSPKYLGRCPQCDAWNTFVESVETSIRPAGSAKQSREVSGAQPVRLSAISQVTKTRTKTGILELDHVLGGGVVDGQVILLAGEPGVGKSTLLLQVVNRLDVPVLYVSGEESPEQIGLRAKRLGFSKKQSDTLTLYPETNVEQVIEQYVSLKPKLVIIDSIQTAWSDRLTGAPGSVGQVRECAYALIQAAKHHHIPTIIVGQVTKEGTIAGPKVLEHLVDTVLSMEGSRFEDTRIVRVSKNRFGPTDEVGVFSMQEDGLRELTDPSGSFITQRNEPVPGLSVLVVLEGTRPLLVEVQALVAHSELKSPRRVGNGISVNRLTMMCAILSKYLRLSLDRYDVYVNVSGGMTIAEPAADLGVALAIYSSFKNKPLPAKSVVVGELSLLGEVQEVSRLDRRIKEAKRMGYTTAITYKSAQTIAHAASLL